MNRAFWIVVAVLSAVYVLVPEPSDTVPILGWLDEGIALVILSYSLKKLNIRWLERVVRLFKGKKS